MEWRTFQDESDTMYPTGTREDWRVTGEKVCHPDY